MNYRIVIKEHIDNKRIDRFEGMSIRFLENGETMITGPIPDQAALFAFLAYIRDTGLTLVSLKLMGQISEDT